MRISVARESDPAEPRVAATPETVKKMKALGRRCGGRAGRRRQVRHPRCRTMRRPAPRVGRRRRKDADIVLKVRRPSEAELAGYKPGALVIAIMDPFGNDAALAAMAQGRRHGLRHGADAAHHPGAEHGRAVVPGQSRRLPRRHRRRRRIRPRAADDDDGGRHGAGRQGVRHGRRRRRPAGDRDRAPARRHRHGDRCAARRQGAGREPRREVRRRRGRGIQAGRDRRRLRQGNVEGLPGEAGGAGRRAHQEAGHRHHHGADPRPPGAAPDLARRWWPRCGPAR